MPRLPPLTVPLRGVRHLRLRAGDAAQARTIAISFGDALHTASLPEVGRFLAIRRLDLGRVTADASPTALALLLERKVSEAMSRAVAFDVPGAVAAQAVWFRSRAEALTVLACKLARRESVAPWFWAQVAPGWKEAASPARWHCVLAAAHTGADAAVVAASVVSAALYAASAAVHEILAAMTPKDATFWLLTAGFAVSERNEQSPSHAWAPSPSAARVMNSAVTALCPDQDLLRAANRPNVDARLIWLGTMLATRESPARAARAELPAQVVAWIRQCALISAGTAPNDSDPATRTPLPPRWTAPENDDIHRTDDARAAEPARELRSSATMAPVPSTRGMDRSVSTDADVPGMADTPVNDLSSPYAGLLFLVPILRRLGMAQHISGHPDLLEAAFPARLLLHLGHEAGLRDDDPLACSLAELAGDQPCDRVPAWRFHAWSVAVRRWCRRKARIHWRDLVEREGRVHTGRTHIEILFSPRQADLRLRRLALDADPGWVSWLGCVIRFHYVSPDEHHR